jgi:outer membrane murein-binding lipoprotein Lpp
VNGPGRSGRGSLAGCLATIGRAHRGASHRRRSDAAARAQDLRDRIDRQRNDHDVKKAERQAEAAEEDAADALDYALWVVDQAQLAVLDAIDARSWANARAAASPPS